MRVLAGRIGEPEQAPLTPDGFYTSACKEAVMSGHSTRKKVSRQPETADMFPCLGTGVYCIRNKENDKRYIGSAAISLSTRWRQHRQTAQAGRHRNRHFQAAWDSYGEDAFEFTVLEHCLPGDCLAREQHWIDFYNATDREFGYNASPTAGSSLGIKRSAETRAKVAAAFRGKPAHNRGVSPSAETRAKIAATLTGRKLGPHSAEHRAKIGAANAIAQKGRKPSDEIMAKLHAGNRGRKLTPEHIAKSVAGRRGYKHTAETRAKMSAAKKARRERLRYLTSVLAALAQMSLEALET